MPLLTELIETTIALTTNIPPLAGLCAQSLAEDVESLAGFQEGLQAGKHARPAAGNFLNHRRTSLETSMGDGEARHVFHRFKLKRDARFVFEIVRVGPRQHEAFGRRRFQDFTGDPDFALGIMVFPFRALLPIGDVRHFTPILAGEFGFGDGRPHIFRRRADIGDVN